MCNVLLIHEVDPNRITEKKTTTKYHRSMGRERRKVIHGRKSSQGHSTYNSFLQSTGKIQILRSFSM